MAKNTQDSAEKKPGRSWTSLLEVPTSRKESIERLAGVLNGTPAGRSVVLSTHINSDGDGCGSEVALARLLAQMDCDVTIVNPTPWPEMFRFIAEGVKIVEANEGGAEVMKAADVIFVLDISDLRRLSVLGKVVQESSAPVLVIDHHVPAEPPLGTEALSDTSACATGELIYDWAVTLDLEITPEIARGIYTAIMTDTGAFRFSNTNPRCLAIAAVLLAVGVSPDEMYQRIYASVPVGKIRLLRDALATLEVDQDYGLAWIQVGKDALDKYNILAEDLDGLVEHARSIKGTRMAIFFRELPNGRVKMSFRAAGDTDVDKFARQFEGGGHKKASGAITVGSLEDVKARVLSAARDYLGRIGQS